MSRPGASLIVASFASKTELSGLTSTLVQLDYAYEIVPGQIWLDHPGRYSRHQAILFLGSADYPRTQLLRGLYHAETRPSLVISRDDECRRQSVIRWRCQEFLSWPCEKEALARCLERICGVESRSPEDEAEAGILEEFARFNMIGASPAFLELVKLVKRVATYDAPVLIEGETGTGKELTARAIHYLGTRRDYPFIPVNCGAVPDNLVENELFGHEKGAFTDAKEAQKGLVAQAQGGTLFLDEVETLSAKAQVALLRFFQDHECRPLGSKCSRRAELRLVAATNSNLRALVERGEFRQDLFFRLNVISLRLPSLREREGDIELLARECIRKASARYKEPIKALHPDTLAWMQQYDWPGNVRELENFIYHAFLTTEDTVIYVVKHRDTGSRQATDIRLRMASPFDKDFNHAKAEVIRDFERRYLSWLMAQTRGNITLAAKQAGKERREIGKLLKKHEIDRSQFF